MEGFEAGLVGPTCLLGIPQAAIEPEQVTGATTAWMVHRSTMGARGLEGLRVRNENGVKSDSSIPKGKAREPGKRHPWNVGPLLFDMVRGLNRFTCSGRNPGIQLFRAASASARAWRMEARVGEAPRNIGLIAWRSLASSASRTCGGRR